MADRKFWEDIEDTLDPPGSRTPKDFELQNFWTAVRDDDLKAVERMLTRFPNIERISITDSKEGKPGDQALHMAARLGRTRVIDLLLAKSATIEDRNSVTGETALSSAAMANQRATVEHLLSKGAEIEAKDNDGRTALWHAAAAGYDASAEALLLNKADIETCDARRRTPLIAALLNHNDSSAILLLEYGAKTHVADADTNSPLSLVAGRQPKDIQGPRLHNMLIQRSAEERQAAREQQMREMAEEITTVFHSPVDMSGKTMSPLKFRGTAPA